MKKLKRLYRTEGYTTGESQQWTSEYTWEDFEATKNVISGKKEMKIVNDIRNFFIMNPEKLITDGIPKQMYINHNMTIEQLKQQLNGEVASIYFQ